MIPPDTFIGMAEETGHIRPLTDWVIDRAIADQRRLREAGRDMTLSVNVSGRLIANEQFADRALRQIRRSGARLCFEITETAVIDNPKLALDVMKDLRDAGVGISIDDYGSGLSSLSYLRTIPAQELKIDKVFIQGMARGNSDALLVKSTIDLAHSLGMTVAAEGVETAESLALLQAMGADTAQGYLHRPPDADRRLPEVRSRAAARAPRRASRASAKPRHRPSRLRRTPSGASGRRKRSAPCRLAALRRDAARASWRRRIVTRRNRRPAICLLACRAHDEAQAARACAVRASYRRAGKPACTRLRPAARHSPAAGRSIRPPARPGPSRAVIASVLSAGCEVASATARLAG